MVERMGERVLPGRSGAAAIGLSTLRRLSLGRYGGALIGLVGFFTYLAITEPVFLTWHNWQNILRANTVVFILAIGATYVVITAGFDLSAAAMTAVAGMVLGMVLDSGAPWVVALLAAVAVSTGIGLTNGILIGVVGISFFVVTLGAMSIYTGVALLLTNGETLSLFTLPSFSFFTAVANDNLGPIPYAVVLSASLYLMAAVVLHFTGFGRAVYAVGSNPEAARLAGIRVGLVLVSVYTISGLIASLAAVVQVGRLGAAAPQVDPTLVLTVVAAVLIGGTSYTGGEGGLFGTVIGVLFLGVVQNGLILSSISTFWQGVVSGVILIFAVGLDVLRGRGFGFRERARARAQLQASEGGDGAELSSK
jgi:ribose transport system permease protein